MAIDAEILCKAERALGIKLYEWQRAYLTDEPIKISISIMGRVQGHTTAYILKLLLEDTEAAALDLTSRRAIAEVMDWWSFSTYHNRYSNIGYADWFKRMLVDIKRCLHDAGIATRRVAESKRAAEYMTGVKVW